MQSKIEPFAHQRACLSATRDLEYWGLFWEQGTGKTKTVIDTAAHLWERGEVDGLLVWAPNGVHRNWVTDEIPTHMPDEVPVRCLTWYSSKCRTKRFQAEFQALIAHRGLAVLAMSYDAAVTPYGRRACETFLERRACLAAGDESARIKTPGARRTKLLVGAGRNAGFAHRAPYRRVLTGTPVGNSPFDVWAQMRFLDRDFWKPHGLDKFYAFKHHFGVFKPGFARGGAHQFEELVSYRRLDQLRDILDGASSRVLKVDCLDLPPKVYQKRYVEMTHEQKKAYETLRDQYRVELASGEEVTAVLAITRIMRLQQIVCGYLPLGDVDCTKIWTVNPNPRIRMLLEVIEDAPGKVIVWARFRHDIDTICEALAEADISMVRYDGSTSEIDRAEAIVRFQGAQENTEDGADLGNGVSVSFTHDPARVFVANPACAGEGLTLHAAETVVYYSNSFKLIERLQSEDRAHRIGQEKTVTYVDLVCPDTVDEQIVAALRDKHDVAAQITGDTLGEWI